MTAALALTALAAPATAGADAAGAKAAAAKAAGAKAAGSGVPALPTGPVPAGFASWQEVYAFQTRLNNAAGQILGAGGASNAGNASIVAAPANRELRVYWNGAVPQSVRELAAGLDVPVKFLPAAYTFRELVGQAQQVAADPQVAVAAPKPDGSGVAVTVTAGSLRSSLHATVPLTVTTGERPRAMSGRQADTPPFWGGARFDKGANNCSTGFPVRIENQNLMLTAGHCGDVGQTVTVPGQPGTVTGTVARKFACVDTETIDFSGRVGTQVYRGPFNSALNSPILGATPDFVGNLVITGGAASGEHSNLQVTAVDQFVNVVGIPECLVRPMTGAGLSGSACAVAPGDSGGPVYSVSGSGVLARGTISASTGTPATCPGTSPAGANFVWYVPMIRPAGDPQIGLLNFWGATWPFATAFDLNGRWTVPGSRGQPSFLVTGSSVQVDMSALGRPLATGQVIDPTTFTLRFPDDTIYTGRLESPNRIVWSNNTVWTKS